MPVAVYLFSVCTFAFGLSEFVVAGLVSAMAEGLHARIEAVGSAIAAYAFGAAIGAPLITALVSHWRDRRILGWAMAVLAVGSALMSVSATLPILLVVRFGVGLAHGVFMAVASDAATRLVDEARAGRAVAVVWIGLTLALALGVPLGTFLGSVWSWRAVFAAIGVLALAGMAGLWWCMPARDAGAQSPQHRPSAWAGLRAIAHPRMLMTAGVGALVSVATFCFFTFISPYLLQISGADVAWLSTAMLLFGLFSIAGNLLGGYLVDKMDPDRAALLALTGLAATLLGLYLGRDSAWMVVALAGALGLVFFCIVTVLTLRLLKLAQRHAPQSTAVGAGLNIASFNLGTAVGGGLGSLTIAWAGLPALPLMGAVAAGAAMAAVWLQSSRKRVRQAA
ncbi:MFS transporter [Achromobacter kerstersii]|uniref:Inner membrane transport protein YdhP n=1 Tax=Achromobacter kerstersii TaxID=1353890 RepID=A0A6S6ZC36_9BURK|nr:MFS transporter [Achromobacter kerstersii]CAB3671027.1 Inner membrane transport protein YdhP [Achromobacter kerstersii]